MITSITTVLIIGLLAGFIFSMPIAGPISIIVTSNALKGRQHFCTQTAIGASLVEFVYVFIVVFGIAKLYAYYQTYMPVILLVGALFIFVIAWKIFKTNIGIEELNKKCQSNVSTENRKGLQVGMLVNLTNPTLLFGWLTSSFMVLSLASSIGLNTGGLDLMVGKNVSLFEGNTPVQATTAGTSELMLAILYAFGVAIGCAVWFILLSKTIIKYRSRLNLNYLNIIIKTLGIVLFAMGIYLVAQACKAII